MDWKRIWRETVENFQREMASGDASALGSGGRHAQMRRDLTSARAEIRKMETDLGRVLQDAQKEREAEAQCRRRQQQADRIGDGETSRIAAAYGERHAQRAVIFERKVEVLRAEFEMYNSELIEMEAALVQVSEHIVEVTDDEKASAPPTSTRRTSFLEDDEFVMRKAQREARERAAEAKLEELKKRMK